MEATTTVPGCGHVFEPKPCLITVQTRTDSVVKTGKQLARARCSLSELTPGLRRMLGPPLTSTWLETFCSRSPVVDTGLTKGGRIKKVAGEAGTCKAEGFYHAVVLLKDTTMSSVLLSLMAAAISPLGAPATYGGSSGNCGETSCSGGHYGSLTTSAEVLNGNYAAPDVLLRDDCVCEMSGSAGSAARVRGKWSCQGFTARNIVAGTAFSGNKLRTGQESLASTRHRGSLEKYLVEANVLTRRRDGLLEANTTVRFVPVRKPAASRSLVEANVLTRQLDVLARRPGVPMCGDAAPLVAASKDPILRRHKFAGIAGKRGETSPRGSFGAQR
ncbi:hypothetical protein Bbelb_204420 [Branchiostoma belcheri]|nr:hypothetical protein Bbelb_204420 [Branchiostoma belcheri]